jgi:hypothetical protein
MMRQSGSSGAAATWPQPATSDAGRLVAAQHPGDFLNQSDGILTVLRSVVSADSVELVSGSTEHAYNLRKFFLGHPKVHEHPPSP